MSGYNRVKNKLFLLFYVFIILHGVSLRSQQTEVDEPLVTVLTKLQERFQIQFNYASELIDEIRIIKPKGNLLLKDAIAYLKEQTGLDFVFISDAVISIKAKSLKLCGYVRDKDTGEPLPYTTVQCNGRGTVTNDEGYFELPTITTSGVVLIRHIGHRTIRRELRFFSIMDCGIVHMVAEQQQLPEIVLSHYLIRGMDKLDNGSFRLDFDKFSILPGLVDEDVLQSVQALPGIQSIDETVSNINIRGGSNDQNLILWDNISIGTFLWLNFNVQSANHSKGNFAKNGYFCGLYRRGFRHHYHEFR